nr:hypothetical protein [Candidatus Sigynarchaeota archaeon]
MNESGSQTLEIQYLEESLDELYNQLALNMEHVVQKLFMIWMNLSEMERRIERIERNVERLSKTNP